MAIQVSGCTVIDNSRNLVNVTIGDTILLPTAGRGAQIEGGYLICKNNQINVAWIVANKSAEVSRNWYNISDAVTRAQQVTGCTGWFLPNASLLVNPGCVCREFWDYSTQFYWANTEINAACACPIPMFPETTFPRYKTCVFCVRAFRCVSY